jgi:hypothetical protein
VLTIGLGHNEAAGSKNKRFYLKFTTTKYNNMFGGPPPPPSEEELKTHTAQVHGVVKQTVYMAAALWFGKCIQPI